jgi:hypothetical protein
LGVLPDSKNAAKLIKVLRDFGFGALDLSLEDFMIPDKAVQLGQPPNRIDIITSISGVDFADCFPATTVTEVDGILLRFISLDDLKKTRAQPAGLKS